MSKKLQLSPTNLVEMGALSTVLANGYNDSLTSNAEQYARALAKLAGLDARTGSVSASLAALQAQYSADCAL